ncbi:hypothetical protein [Lentzea sp. NBRC 105346]|nr:hypothetical protein [Lentzea sp. NBRC 105346]
MSPEKPEADTAEQLQEVLPEPDEEVTEDANRIVSVDEEDGV